MRCLVVVLVALAAASLGVDDVWDEGDDVWKEEIGVSVGGAEPEAAALLDTEDVVANNDTEVNDSAKVEYDYETIVCDHDSCPANGTKIFVFDDILSPETFDAFMEEISELEGYFRRTTPVGKRTQSYERFYIDEHYTNRMDSTILRTVSALLFNHNLYRTVEAHHDLSWQLLRVTTNHETQITAYTDNDGYPYHRDHWVDSDDGSMVFWSGRILNFILYLNHDGFVGGNLEMVYKTFPPPSAETRPNILIRPKRNRLVLMPSYLWHRVTPVRSATGRSADEMLLSEARLTVNGHVGFREAMRTSREFYMMEE